MEKFSAADVQNPTSGTWHVQAIIDRRIQGVVIEGSLHAATVLLFPDRPLTLTSLGIADWPAAGGVEVSIAIWILKSTWKEYKNE